jgi:8-oxo-dGTP pyrophosphatase MutT (NUDIX family)
MALQQTNNVTPLKSLGNMDQDKTYVERSAVRAILINPPTQHIAIIHVAKGNFFKLSSDGVEADKDHALALAREVLEETGCKVFMDDAKCFAKSEEWRNDLHQISFCYVAKLVEDTEVAELTELEASEGLSHRWVSVDEAIELMRNAEPTSDLGEFIKERDIFFVEKFATG